MRRTRPNTPANRWLILLAALTGLIAAELIAGPFFVVTP